MIITTIVCILQGTLNRDWDRRGASCVGTPLEQAQAIMTPDLRCQGPERYGEPGRVEMVSSLGTRTTLRSETKATRLVGCERYER